MKRRWMRRSLLVSLLAGAILFALGASAHAQAAGLGTVIGQSQHASYANSTSQFAGALASTNQVNVNAPIAVLSPGSNNGDVSQSNNATTTARASNENRTNQSIGQSQQARTFEKGAHHRQCGCHHRRHLHRHRHSHQRERHERRHRHVRCHCGCRFRCRPHCG